MNRFRYVDKKILCSYDLSQELFDLLGIEVEDLIPLRKVFILITNKGKKILKITDSEEERIKFIDEALNYVRQNDKNILNYSKNVKGKLITRWKNKNYILLDLIEGREATFTNPVEVEFCAEALANMHKASIGIENNIDKDIIKKNKGKDIISLMEEDKIFISKCKNLVSKFKYKNEFDILFLNNVDKLYLDLCTTIEMISTGPYNSLRNELVLCHNDLAHHNFITTGSLVSIIDFDYSNINTRINDIYNFTNKVLKTVSYDKEYIKLIVNGYNKVSVLSKDEIKVLYDMIHYPKDLITLAKNYYLKQKSWDEEVFISRIKEKIELDEYRRENKL